MRHDGLGQRSRATKGKGGAGRRRVREQYADSGGFTDHVFAVTSLLGYRFIPRIRDLPSKRLHVFEPRRVPKPLTGLTGNKIRQDVIVRNRPDILRVAATLASGVLPPSITTTLPKFGQFLARNRFAETKVTKLSSAWAGRHGEVLKAPFLRSVVVILGRRMIVSLRSALTSRQTRSKNDCRSDFEQEIPLEQHNGYNRCTVVKVP